MSGEKQRQFLEKIKKIKDLTDGNEQNVTYQ